MKDEVVIVRESNPENEINLNDVIVGLLRRKKIVIYATIICTIIGFLVFGVLKNNIPDDIDDQAVQTYYAKTNFIVGCTESISPSTNLKSYQKFDITESLLSTYEELLTSRTAMQNVINELSLETTPDELKNMITLSKAETNNILTIVVSYKDQAKVTEIANAVVKEFDKTIKDVYVADKLTVIDEAYILEDASPFITIQTKESIEKAHIKKVIIFTALSAIAGFSVSFIYILILEILDNTIKSEDTLIRHAKVNVLTKLNPASPNIINKFDLLRANLEHCEEILVTGPDSNKDIDYVATNLAKAFAKVNRKTVLIDLTTNESPLVDNYDGNGIFQAFSDSTINIKKYINPTNTNEYDIILSGTNDINFVEEIPLLEISKTLQNTYEVVIVKTKEVITSVDTLTAIKAIENTVLVAKERKTTLPMFRKAKSIVSNDGTHLGTVLLK